MIASTTEIRVRYAETDRMGVAYHANYLTWFEVARVQMLDEIGCPYRDLEADGYRLPVFEANIRYLRPLTFDDRVTIEAVMKEKPGLRIRIDYTVSCRDELIARGFTRHAFINADGRPTRPPPSFRALIESHFPNQPSASGA